MLSLLAALFAAVNLFLMENTSSMVGDYFAPLLGAFAAYIAVGSLLYPDPTARRLRTSDRPGALILGVSLSDRLKLKHFVKDLPLDFWIRVVVAYGLAILGVFFLGHSSLLSSFGVALFFLFALTPHPNMVLLPLSLTILWLAADQRAASTYSASLRYVFLAFEIVVFFWGRSEVFRAGYFRDEKRIPALRFDPVIWVKPLLAFSGVFAIVVWIFPKPVDETRPPRASLVSSHRVDSFLTIGETLLSGTVGESKGEQNSGVRGNTEGHGEASEGGGGSRGGGVRASAGQGAGGNPELGNSSGGGGKDDGFDHPSSPHESEFSQPQPKKTFQSSNGQGQKGAPSPNLRGQTSESLMNPNLSETSQLSPSLEENLAKKPEFQNLAKSPEGLPESKKGSEEGKSGGLPRPPGPSSAPGQGQSDTTLKNSSASGGGGRADSKSTAGQSQGQAGSNYSGTSTPGTSTLPAKEVSKSVPPKRKIEPKEIWKEVKTVVLWLMVIGGLGLLGLLIAFWLRRKKGVNPQLREKEALRRKAFQDFLSQFQDDLKNLEDLDPQSLRQRVIRLYQNFLKYCESCSCGKPIHLTPDEFAQALGRFFPTRKRELLRVASTFCLSLYGEHSPHPKSFKQFAEDVLTLGKHIKPLGGTNDSAEKNGEALSLPELPRASP